MKNLFTKFSLIAALCAIAVSSVSCDDDNKGGGDKPAVETSVSSLRFTSGSYSKSFTVNVKTAASWSVDVEFSGTDSWVTVEKSGDGVFVKVESNTGAARTATVVVSAPGMTDAKVAVEQQEAFSSELIGVYAPHVDPMSSDYGLFLSTEWNEKGAPSLDLSAILGAPIEWETIEFFLPMLIGSTYYSQGLASLDLKEDGRLAAGYRVPEFEGGFSIESMLNPQFGNSPVLVFPDAQAPVVPSDAVTYYTKDGKIYLAVSKEFIASVDPGTLDMPICDLIDTFIKKYGLDFVSDRYNFAVPLKYKSENDVLTLYVDREMILPFKPLLLDVVGMLLEGISEEGGDMPVFDPAMLTGFITDMFDNSTKFEIGVKLALKTE
ncbi:BACON domain-containing protein [Alistipes dispar]|uniref:BACON domain-containing protein n=1 Tax=Alistipes dispar TaxID=2585119 RepID=UPI003A949719